MPKVNMDVSITPGMYAKWQRYNDAITRAIRVLNGETSMMTQFAPVCGVQMYEQMAIRGILPNYHLLLAHDVVNPDRSDRYSNVFRSLTARNQNYTIIMDNSITELGNATGPEVTMRAAAYVNANVIVLPDVYEDCEGTIASTYDNYKEWKQCADDTLGPENYSFMVVPQGKTIQEMAKCVEALSGFGSSTFMNKIHWWGIPRNAVKWHGTRLHTLRLCATLNPTRAIHMLGFSDNLVDDWETVHFSDIFVRGIDSAVPLRCSAHGLTFSLSLGEMPKRHEDWLTNAPFTEEVARNWDYARHLFTQVR